MIYDSEKEVMISEINFYCTELDMPLPDGFPDRMTKDEMRHFIEIWSEYDPIPELD